MDKRLLRRQLKGTLLKKNPLALIEAVLALEDLVNERLVLAKGDKGDSIKGDKGERGEKGEKGEPGIDGISIKGDKGDRGEPGKDGRDGKDGKDATVDLTPILKKIEEVKKFLEKKQITVDDVLEEVKKQKLDAKYIKNLPVYKKQKTDFSDMRWHGGGLTSSQIYTETGIISSLTTLTTQRTINVILGFIINGQGLHLTTDYTVSSPTITYVTALDASLIGKPYTVVYV